MFQEPYALPSGIYCFKCAKGEMVSEDCDVDWTNSECVRCPDHHFSDAQNKKKHCKLCRSSCPKFGVQIHSCTPITNRECTCQPGYHVYPLDSIDTHYEFECEPHNACPAGYGESSYGKWVDVPRSVVLVKSHSCTL